MTRDEVLEQAARHLEQPAFPWVPDPMVAAPWAARVRALKSRPPEKSPEVEDRYALLLAQRDREYVEAQALRLERDHLKARLETSERERRTDRMLLDKRENVSAQLESMTVERDALRVEVSRLKWEANGARMKGE